MRPVHWPTILVSWTVPLFFLFVYGVFAGSNDGIIVAPSINPHVGDDTFAKRTFLFADGSNWEDAIGRASSAAGGGEIILDAGDNNVTLVVDRIVVREHIHTPRVRIGPALSVSAQIEEQAVFPNGSLFRTSGGDDETAMGITEDGASWPPQLFALVDQPDHNGLVVSQGGVLFAWKDIE